MRALAAGRITAQCARAASRCRIYKHTVLRVAGLYGVASEGVVYSQGGQELPLITESPSLVCKLRYARKYASIVDFCCCHPVDCSGSGLWTRLI